MCIQKLVAVLGEHVTKQLPVVHATSGCITTSSLYGHGKVGVYEQLSTVSKTEHAYQLSEIVGCCGAALPNNIEAGLQLMVLIYGSKSGDTLNHLHCASYACSSSCACSC